MLAVILALVAVCLFLDYCGRTYMDHAARGAKRCDRSANLGWIISR